MDNPSSVVPALTDLSGTTLAGEFKYLSQSKGPPVMNVLGQVGQGITLSIQGKHKESNDMFQKAQKAIPPDPFGKPMTGAFFNSTWGRWFRRPSKATRSSIRSAPS